MNDRDHSPGASLEDSPRNDDGKSYSGSPSPERYSEKNSYREWRRDREDREDRMYRSRSRYKFSKCVLRQSSRRSHSRSPMSSRRRHVRSCESPEPSRCLGVFGLSVYTSEDDLYHVMSKYGPIEKVQVIIDAKTGYSRGFAFVYFENTEDAKVAKEQCNGMKIDRKIVRVDYSITERAHTPTPGLYMGKPTYKYSGRYDRRRDRYDYYGSRYSRYNHRRSASSYYRRRHYDRSRSRSP